MLAGPLACGTCHHGGAERQSLQDSEQDHAGHPDMANRGGDGGTLLGCLGGVVSMREDPSFVSSVPGFGGLSAASRVKSSSSWCWGQWGAWGWGGAFPTRADVSFPSAEHGDGASAHQKLRQLLRGGLLRAAVGRAVRGHMGNWERALP